jgi:hypothetical protein
MHMEKDKINTWIIGILGLVSLGVPAFYAGDFFLWSWGLMASFYGDVGFVLAEGGRSAAIFGTLFLGTAIVFAIGAILYLLAVTIESPKIKLPTRLAWVPGMLMTIGIAFPVFYALEVLIGETTFFTPMGIVSGLVAGIWAWVRGAKASKPASQ